MKQTTYLSWITKIYLQVAMRHTDSLTPDPLE